MSTGNQTPLPRGVIIGNLEVDVDTPSDGQILKFVGGKWVNSTGGGGDAREVQIQKSATHIQWRYEGDTAWTNLVALSELKGDTGDLGPTGPQGLQGNAGTNGKQVEFQKTATHIQWRYVGETWADLVALADIKGDTGAAASLTTQSAFATAETTISAATYADIAGCSISLTAGTWLIFAHVVARNVNAIIQVFAAITDGANTVIAESAISRPASGTASLNAPISTSWQAIVSPTGTTTYKLRGARGLTTHTGNWIAMDGTGYNTTNHASNNSDKGTSIIAVKIA